jgi:hypothetical protein
MPWEYSRVEPAALPECPWCHSDAQVEPWPERTHKYRCDCGTSFEAEWHPDAITLADPPMADALPHLSSCRCKGCQAP